MADSMQTGLETDLRQGTMSNRDDEPTGRALLRQRQERLALAAGLAERGELALARRELQQMLAEDPQYAPARALLARLGQRPPDPAGATASRLASGEETRAHEPEPTSKAGAESSPTLPGTTVSTGSWAQFQRRMQLRRETTCMTAMRQAMEAGDYRTALDRARELVGIDPAWQEIALFLEQVQAQAPAEASTGQRRGPAPTGHPRRSAAGAMGNLSASGTPGTATRTAPTAALRPPGVAVRQDAIVRRRRSRVPALAVTVLVTLVAAAALGWGVARFFPDDTVWRWAAVLRNRLAPAATTGSRPSPAQPSPLAEVPELPFAGIVPPPGGNLVQIPNENTHPQEANAGATQPPGNHPGTVTPENGSGPAGGPEPVKPGAAAKAAATPAQPAAGAASPPAMTHAPAPGPEPPVTRPGPSPAQHPPAPATPEPVAPRSTTAPRADAARVDRPTSANAGVEGPTSTKTLAPREAPPLPEGNAGNTVASASGAGGVSDTVPPPAGQTLPPQTLPPAVPGLPATDPRPPAPSTAQSPAGASDDSPSGTRATTGATPPPQAQTTVGTDTEAEDREAIAKTIGAYAQGYTSLNAAAVRRIWPGVNEDALRNAFGQLESQRVVFSGCMVAIRDLHATATCRGTATYVPKVGAQERMSGSHEWRFTLRKRVDAWVIESASIR